MNKGDSSSDAVRLNKFLAERLGVSRRQADDMIAEGKISWRRKTAVQDHASSDFSAWQTATLGDRIDKSYEVCYNGDRGVVFGDKLTKTTDGRLLIPMQASYLYYGMNKPVGYVCSRRAQGDAATIFDLLPERLRSLKTVGRLDKDSSGLILLTNDGDFAYRMTHPKFVKEKVYLVELDRDLAPLHQQEIADFGVEIGDGVSRLGLARLTAEEFERAMSASGSNNKQSAGGGLANAKHSSETRKFFRVIMSEGRNRQIRRTFAALGYEVIKLHRIQFGKYQLGDLASGELQPVPKVD